MVAEVGRPCASGTGIVQALDRVDVAIEPGCTGLVGLNGAGKSTPIKLLLACFPCSTRRASVLGHDVAVDPLAVRARVGYPPEGARLPGDVTAADFVAFMAQLGRLPPCPGLARERAAEVCYQVGLEEERYRAVGVLHGHAAAGQAGRRPGPRPEPRSRTSRPTGWIPRDARTCST